MQQLPDVTSSSQSTGPFDHFIDWLPKNTQRVKEAAYKLLSECESALALEENALQRRQTEYFKKCGQVLAIIDSCESNQTTWDMLVPLWEFRSRLAKVLSVLKKIKGFEYFSEAEKSLGMDKLNEQTFVISKCLMKGWIWEPYLLDYLEEQSDFRFENAHINQIAHHAVKSSCSLTAFKKLQDMGMIVNVPCDKLDDELLHHALNFIINTSRKAGNSCGVEVANQKDKLWYLLKNYQGDIGALDSKGNVLMDYILMLQFTDLHSCVLDMVKYLLSVGFDPRQHEGKRVNLLSFAAECFEFATLADGEDPWKVLKLLIEAGAPWPGKDEVSVLAPALQWAECSFDHFLQLMDIVPLGESVIVPDQGIPHDASGREADLFFKKLSAFLKRYPDYSFTSEDSFHLLALCFRSSCPEDNMQFLTEVGIEVDAVGHEKITLIAALILGSADSLSLPVHTSVERLIQAGAKLKQKTLGGESLAELAVMQDDAATLSVLVHHRPEFLTSGLLQFAVQSDQSEVIRFLFENGVEPNKWLKKELSLWQDGKRGRYDNALQVVDECVREGYGALGREYRKLEQSLEQLRADLKQRCRSFQKEQLTELLGLQKDGQRNEGKIIELQQELPNVIKKALQAAAVNVQRSIGQLKMQLDRAKGAQVSLQKRIQAFFAKKSAIIAAAATTLPRTKQQAIERIRTAGEGWVGDFTQPCTGLHPEEKSGLESLRESFLDRYRQGLSRICREIEEAAEVDEVSAAERKWKEECRRMQDELQKDVEVLGFRAELLADIKAVSREDEAWIDKELVSYEKRVSDFERQVSGIGLQLTVPGHTLKASTLAKLQALDSKVICRLRQTSDLQDLRFFHFQWKNSRKAVHSLLNKKVLKRDRKLTAQQRNLCRLLQSMAGEPSPASEPQHSKMPSVKGSERLESEQQLDISGRDLADFQARILETLRAIQDSGKCPEGVTARQLKKLIKKIGRLDRLKKLFSFTKVLAYLGYELKKTTGGHMQFEHTRYGRVDGEQTFWTLDHSGTLKDPLPRRVALAKRALLIATEWEREISEERE